MQAKSASHLSLIAESHELEAGVTSSTAAHTTNLVEIIYQALDQGVTKMGQISQTYCQHVDACME